MLPTFLLNLRIPFDTHRFPLTTILSEAIGAIREIVPSGSRVLDIGCGTGWTAKELIDKKGCEVIGVEPNELRAEVARSNGIQVHVAISRICESKKPTSSMLSSSEMFLSISPIRFPFFATRRNTSDRVVAWWSRSRMLPTGWSGLTFFAVDSTTSRRVSWMRLTCAGLPRRHFDYFSKTPAIVLTSGVSLVATGCRSMHRSDPSDGCANRIDTV